MGSFDKVIKWLIGEVNDNPPLGTTGTTTICHHGVTDRRCYRCEKHVKMDSYDRNGPRLKAIYIIIDMIKAFPCNERPV
jgi:hypothetical protein